MEGIDVFRLLKSTVSLLIKVAKVLPNIIWTELTRPKPTNNVRIIKRDLPEPPEIPEPPNPPIINEVKPTVDNIFIQNNNTNITNVNVTIDLPKRILPVELPPPPPPVGGGGGSTNTQVDIRSVVKQSLANRKYGCLLARPFFKEPIKWCEKKTIEIFYNELVQDMTADLTLAKQNLENDNEMDDYVALSLATAMVSLTPLGYTIPITGVKQLDKLAQYYELRNNDIGNLLLTGLYPIGGLKLTTCEPPTIEYVVPTFNILVANQMDECAIPITFFSDMDGFKRDQLQLIYYNKANKKQKRGITLPSVKQNMSEIDAQLKSQSGSPPAFRFPELKFGNVLIEIWHDLEELEAEGHVQPVQKAKYWSNFTRKEEIQLWVYETYKVWLETFCEKVKIKTFNVTMRDDLYPEKFAEGDYAPYRAVFMGWDKEKARWVNKQAWYLDNR